VDGERLLLRFMVMACVLLVLLMAAGWHWAGLLGAATGVVLTQVVLFLSLLARFVMQWPSQMRVASAD
jgi:hypothetical protein